MSGRRRVIGLHAAEAAIRNTPDKLQGAWLDSQRGDKKLSQLRRELEILGVQIRNAERRQLDQMTEGGNHQGVVLEMDMPRELGEDELRDVLQDIQGKPLFLVLDHIQDPHNLGACLRSADAAGVRGVIVTKDQAVGLTPVVAKVAAGAAETVPLYRVTNLARSLGWMKDAGIWLAGAAGEAPKTCYETDFNRPLGIVLGAEGKGMRRLTRETCDFLVRIPMHGQVESLNVSVATGILLFEAVRQQMG